MPATSQERSRFRRKLNGSVDSMPDAYIDDVLAEALERYPETGYERQVAFIYALILGIRDLRARAASLTDYDQNDSSDKRSQFYAALANLEKSYQADLEKLIAPPEAETNLPAVRWGGANRVPPVDPEWPS